MNSIRSNLAEHISSVAEIAIKYNPFFHQLVYHMRYKEHISIPEKIGIPETMRKNEIELASIRTCIITECRMANIPTQLEVVIN